MPVQALLQGSQESKHAKNGTAERERLAHVSLLRARDRRAECGLRWRRPRPQWTRRGGTAHAQARVRLRDKFAE